MTLKKGVSTGFIRTISQEIRLHLTKRNRILTHLLERPAEVAYCPFYPCEYSSEYDGMKVHLDNNHPTPKLIDELTHVGEAWQLMREDLQQAYDKYVDFDPAFRHAARVMSVDGGMVHLWSKEETRGFSILLSDLATYFDTDPEDPDE